jgi:hypothetical protein
MYLLDPQEGRRRRALLREQIDHARNRAQGIAVDAQRAVTSDLQAQKPAESPQAAQHLGR